MEDDKPTSIVYDHCVNVYEEMKNQSREEERGLVYEGHLTKLFNSLQLSTPYYTSVKNHLTAMGCIEQLRRGGGNAPSRWLLLAEPDEETFNDIVDQKRSKTGRVAVVEQRVRDLVVMLTEVSNRVQVLESRTLGDHAHNPSGGSHV